jgi:hypothetical protein
MVLTCAVQRKRRDRTYSVVLSEHVQLILWRAGKVRTEGKEGVCLEESVSEIEDEDVGLRSVVLEPIF